MHIFIQIFVLVMFCIDQTVTMEAKTSETDLVIFSQLLVTGDGVVDPDTDMDVQGRMLI